MSVWLRDIRLGAIVIIVLGGGGRHTMTGARHIGTACDHMREVFLFSNSRSSQLIYYLIRLFSSVPGEI